MFSNYLFKGCIISLVFPLVFASCKESKCIKAPDVSHIDVKVEIERLDRKLYKIPTKEALEEILITNPLFAEEFLMISEYPSPVLVVDRFYNLMNSGQIDSLFIEVETAFGEMDDIREEFVQAFKYLKYYYPDFREPRIQTVVTGIANDLYISDSLIIIGLDFYLGPHGKYRPHDIPAYLLKRYQKAYLVPQIMLMSTNYYNATNYADKTALADMVYYGKAYYMAKNLMPCTADSLLTGYTSSETSDIDKHEQVIWAGILENELLFETSNMLKDKFLSERPKTYELGENCPGRIGRWVGWKIVNKFMDQHPEMTLPQLMQTDDAQRIFNESKYKPIRY